MNWLINRSSESDRCAASVDRIAVIGGRGTPYLCPNIGAVDHHILRLYKQIGAGVAGPSEVVQELWTDIDLLLERRMFLQFDLQVSDAALRQSADPGGNR
jgi:hypothetical protein